MHRVQPKGLLIYAFLLAASRCAEGAPAPSPVVSFAPASATVAFASDDSNGLLWTDTSNIVPEAIRGSLGANILGPQNIPIDLENADFLAPPSTDAGTV